MSSELEAQALTLADIDRIHKTEGPRAADAALQRMKLAREAQGIIAPSNIDDWLVPGDLKVGAGESGAEVIDHLDELDADAEDKAKAERQARKAEMLAAFAVAAANAEAAAKAEAREAQEPTPALKEQTCAPTLDEAPTDIAFSDIENLELVLGDLEVGAGETAAEVIEHLEELDALAEDTPKAESSVVATLAAADGPNTATHAEAAVAEKAERTDIENLDFVLADLKVGAGETSEVVEHLGEPDTSSAAAVKSPIAKTEAYEAQGVPDEAARKEQLRETMRTANAKIRGVKVAPDDPLATDKIKVTRSLEKDGLTLADLPAGYWDEPRDVRGILLGQVVGPVRRLAKRVKRSIDRGYPPDYYSHPRHEQKRISDVVRKRRSRAEQAAKSAPTPKAPLPTTMTAGEWIKDSHTRLKSWTAGSDPMAIQLRGRESDFVKARYAYQRLIKTLGRAPTQSELAAELGCTRWMAQNRIEQLRKLEGVGGPWHDEKA